MLTKHANIPAILHELAQAGAWSEFGEMLSFLETAQSACQAGWFALILIIGMLSLANEYWEIKI